MLASHLQSLVVGFPPQYVSHSCVTEMIGRMTHQENNGVIEDTNSCIQVQNLQGF